LPPRPRPPIPPPELIGPLLPSVPDDSRCSEPSSRCCPRSVADRMIGRPSTTRNVELIAAVASPNIRGRL
jgi:hypothetical protein